jgi:hypothetical protein
MNCHSMHSNVPPPYKLNFSDFKLDLWKLIPHR